VHGADGSFDAPGLPVSVDALRSHAERYGPDGVYETAVRLLSGGELARLRVDLDAMSRDRAPRFGRVKARRRRDETRAAVVALRAEGLAPGAIADKLSVPDATMRRYLRRRRLAVA
jgi:DNA-directed RNA polymerase specialized sigma24 family protein